MYQQILSGGSEEDDPPVFWGYENDVDPVTGDPVLGRAGVESMAPFSVKYSDAMGEFDRWNQAKIRNFIESAVKAGLLPKDADYFQAKQLWQALVNESRDRTAQGDRMSPWDVLSFIGGDSRLKPDGEKKGKPKDVTTVDTNVVLTDPTAARGAVHDMLSGLLGRRATEQELDDYVTTLRSFERNHPDTQTTTTHYNAKGVRTSSNTVTKQGADPTTMMEDKVRGTDEYASYQAAGVYFPLLLQALGATAEVGP